MEYLHHRRPTRASPAAVWAVHALVDERAWRSCASTPTAFDRRWLKAQTKLLRSRAFHDLDSLGLLRNVPTLNFHPHLPHYELTGGASSVQVLARQPIDLERPHPFTEAGNREFNCLLWMPPNEQRAGDIVLVDSTNFTTLFGGTRSSRDLLEESRGDEVSERRSCRPCS